VGRAPARSNVIEDWADDAALAAQSMANLAIERGVSSCASVRIAGDLLRLDAAQRSYVQRNIRDLAGSQERARHLGTRDATTDDVLERLIVRRAAKLWLRQVGASTAIPEGPVAASALTLEQSSALFHVRGLSGEFRKLRHADEHNAGCNENEPTNHETGFHRSEAADGKR
jgi:hypothetical protein